MAKRNWGKNGGIVGITKTASALSRWALSYNLRTQIAKKTKEMLMIDNENDDYIHNECGVSRKKRDEADEGRIIEVLQHLNMFGTSSTALQNIATKDLASSDIESSLLDAEKLGREQLELFVKQRIIKPIDGKQRIDLTAPLARNEALTFASLYTVSTDVGGKPATIKADRNILQRLVTAYRSGRPVNLDNILKHELLPVPVALSSLNGTLNTENKSILADILSCSISTPPQVTVTGSASLVIDGQALINAIGKPSGATTFFEYSTVFLQYVLSIGSSFHRVDIVFDRYFSNSIKSTTRKRRRQGHRPIRRIIEDGSVPLPNNCGNFLSLEENKDNLQEFVSEQLIARAPENKIIVTAEGFKNIQEVRSSNPSVDTSALEAYHEEADTRVVLHCINNSADSVVVYARDTDILVLLLAHFEKMPCKNLWLKAGT